MRALRTLPVVVLGFGLALPAVARDHTPPPVEPATSFAAVEVHKDEHVAIAVVPYDTKKQQSIFRVDYLKYGVIPVRLIVTNLGDQPISLNDARILFETAAGQYVQAAEPADVDRLMKPYEPRSMPMPSPIPGIHFGHRNHNYEKVEEDFNTFEYGSLVVEPHTTRAGFLFYVVPGLDHPLEGAHIFIDRLRNASGHQLYYFEIPFNKDSQSKSGQSH